MVVWLFDRDPDHYVFQKALHAADSSASAFSTWSVVAFLVVLGFVAYFAHRALVHPCIQRRLVRALVKRHAKGERTKPNVRDLAFALWLRRGSAENSRARSVQSALDEGNAGCHFFYCSCWASILTYVFMKVAYPGALHVGCWFWFVVVAFFVVGLIHDYRMTKLDLYAYWEFPEKRARHPT
jgi:hypothetical protein